LREIPAILISGITYFYARGEQSMQQWTQPEKRKAPRFEIKIPVLSYTGPSDIPVPSTLHDLSAYGLGATMDCAMPVGTAVEIVLMMPEKEDQVRLRGTIIWVQGANAFGYHRAGIQFQADHFNPIPYVLKILQSKAKTRFSYNRPYPA
jgi:hypothetical protein